MTTEELITGVRDSVEGMIQRTLPDTVDAVLAGHALRLPDIEPDPATNSDIALAAAYTATNAAIRGTIAELRRRGWREPSEAMTYRGIWHADATYGKGNAVTHDGQLWHCAADGTTTRPGTGGAWQLMHKNGRK